MWMKAPGLAASPHLHQHLGLRPTFLQLSCYSRTSPLAVPPPRRQAVAVSRHLPVGSISSGLSGSGERGLPHTPARHLDSAGTQSEEQDKERIGGRELALATQLGSLQNTRTQPKTLHPHCMLDRPADRCATTRQWQIRQTNAEKHINLALSFSPYMPVLSCIILKQGLLFTMFILCHT